MLLSDRVQGFFDLFPRVSLLTSKALVQFLVILVVDELIRKIDSMKPDREIIHDLEVLTLTAITKKILLNALHFYILLLALCVLWILCGVPAHRKFSASETGLRFSMESVVGGRKKTAWE
jgi:hypothetical protein